MIPILDTHLGGVIVVTLVMMGFAAWSTGRAIAITWRPFWQAVIYPFLLGFVTLSYRNVANRHAHKAEAYAKAHPVDQAQVGHGHH